MVEVGTVLPFFGLSEESYAIERVGTGHIHMTYRLKGDRNFILQRVNTNVFTQPDWIASNMRHASDYLKGVVPDYPFPTCVRSVSGKEMEFDAEGLPWRLFPFIENTMTINIVSSPQEAYEAAREFARLTRNLDQVEVSNFRETIPQFHDLSLRKQQFDDALAAGGDRVKDAKECIEACQRGSTIVNTYKALLAGGDLRKRIVHNDTKINNVLFDKDSRKTVGVIDLDTLMPGYFIYDLGDMVRTFVCPVSEEERDLNLIEFRKDVYEALLSGYLSQMGDVMTVAERKAIPFAGKMMTYIMALRFLADYLRGDTYYHITYPEQNLMRAKNQIKLLDILTAHLK